MSATLSAQQLTVSFGARVLFSELDLVLAPGDVTALVGVNGSGKSSLMRVLVGDLTPEEGTIQMMPPDARVGWLPQVIPHPGESLVEHVRRRTGVAAADQQLEQATAALAAQVAGAEDSYSAALDRWLRSGAADLEQRLDELCAKLGLDAATDRPLGSLSGGEAARVNLIATVLSEFDIALLDEPTNNLDGPGLAVMTDFVRGHAGPVLVASHDRAFLDAVATNVVELDLAQQRIGHYTGSWSDYRAARELDRHHAWEAYENYAETRDSLVAQAQQRAGWATKGRSSPKVTKNPDKHQREKFRARADRQAARAATVTSALQRLPVVAQPRKEWQLRYAIAAGPPSADVVATLSHAVCAQGEFRLGPLDLQLTRGERVAVLGANGAGKSTLLRTLFGQLRPLSGRQHQGTRVQLGWLDQERALLATDQPVADVVRADLVAHSGEADTNSPVAVRTLLAKFGLAADHLDRPAESLSMGERTRALLAIFQARQVNTLVLDEPTNHLDLAAIEQLESALAGFVGTLVVVSHDERFVAALQPTAYWRVAEGGVAIEHPSG